MSFLYPVTRLRGSTGFGFSTLFWGDRINCCTCCMLVEHFWAVHVFVCMIFCMCFMYNLVRSNCLLWGTNYTGTAWYKPDYRYERTIVGHALEKGKYKLYAIRSYYQAGNERLFVSLRHLPSCMILSRREKSDVLSLKRGILFF